MLFDPLTSRSLTLTNRIVMSPMTRSRAVDANTPNTLMAEYYGQRATAGLIITEGTAPSPNALGYPRIPGLYNQAHVRGWKLVTSAVHAAGGKIFVQLMHTGRVGNVLNLPPGAEVIGPGTAVCPGEMYTDSKGMQPNSVPRAMTEADIKHAIGEYAASASLAIEAGFDGVELHGANGYLIEQFLNPVVNQRSDAYGRGIEGRNRFALEVAAAAVKAIGGERLGIRLSPYGVFNGTGEFPEVQAQFFALEKGLAALKLLYVHRVSVWNRDAAAAKKLHGVTVLESPKAAFQNAAVLTMLSDDKAVRSVILDSGALAGARKGCIHVMMATISPAFVEELKTLHRGAGVAYVAAPVFGVPAAAEKAQLNIMAAGTAQDIAAVQPLFDAMGQKTWPMGEDPVRANVAKIAGNMMITLAIEAMGEATALTESYGVKASDFLDVVTNTLFASPSYKRYGGFIASNTYEPGFKLTLGLKDVNLALDAARATHTVLPSAQIVQENMQKAIEQGLGAKDWSILAKIARRRAGMSEDAA